MHYQKKDKFEAAGNYRDLDGNTKSFTFVNHDSKLTATLFNPTDEEIEQIKKDLEQLRKDYQKEILAEPAGYCPYPLQDRYILRGGIDADTFKWKKAVVMDAGLSLDDLSILHTLVFKRKEMYGPRE